MESEQMSKNDLKVEILSETTDHQMIISGGGGGAPASGQGGSGGLSRQTSVTKTNCLCSPTTHPGSFRCRLHRAPSLQRTKSIDSQTAPKPNSATATAAAE